MCVIFKDVPHLADGWGCCGCQTYNGPQRLECKYCEKQCCHLIIVVKPVPQVHVETVEGCLCGGENWPCPRQVEGS